MPRGMTLDDIAIIEEWTFVKIIFPAPYGTLLLTDRPGGYIGDIDDEGSKTWAEEFSLETGPISLSSQDVMVVNWIKFIDLDQFWSNLAKDIVIRGTLTYI